MSLHRPEASEHAPFYARYVGLVPEAPLADTLRAQPDDLAALLTGADGDAAYAPEKWTVAQVVQHLTDTERVFAFRLLWFARGEAPPLPGFDQDAWAASTPGRPLADALAEFRAVRAATVALVDAIPEAAWDRSGEANGFRMTARAAAYVIAGHVLAHAEVLRERYGLGG